MDLIDMTEEQKEGFKVIFWILEELAKISSETGLTIEEMVKSFYMLYEHDEDL